MHDDAVNVKDDRPRLAFSFPRYRAVESLRADTMFLPPRQVELLHPKDPHEFHWAHSVRASRQSSGTRVGKNG